jgi:ABC-type transport system, involved in lipoprotein release, permease component
VNFAPAAFFAARMLGLDARRGRETRDGENAGGSSSYRGRRYLRGAATGVALSLVPLVVVLVVSDGMIEGITARYIEVGSYHLQAQSYYVVTADELNQQAEKLRAQKGTIAAFPEVDSYGVALLGSRTAGAQVRAVDPNFLEDKGTKAYLQLKSGELRLDSGNQILLGESLAKSLGAKVGDAVSLVTSKADAGAGGASGFAPKLSVFRVKGIVSAGYRQLDELWAFISLRSGERIFGSASSRQMIGIKVADPYGPLEGLRARASAALPAEWSVITWPEAERNVYKSFATTRALLLLVMALAVAVAAINVSSALVMLVLERRRDIAILKSAGASPSFISLSFLLAGAGVGGIGTIVGIGAGSLLAWRINDLIAGIEALANACAQAWTAVSGGSAGAAIRLLDPAYYIERIPVQLHPGELCAVAATSVALCFLASLLPARRAARLPPLEIFRKT